MANIPSETLNTNAQLYDSLLKGKYPQLSNWSSEELFKEGNYEVLDKVDGLKEDMLALTMKFYLAFIDRLDVKNPFDANDFGEHFDIPFGEYAQAIRATNLKPINPQWKLAANKQLGADVNPYIMRPFELSERFFRINQDYQNTVFIPDNYAWKKVFAEPYGFATLAIDLITNSLANSYKIQEFIREKEALNAYLNSTNHPLKSTQVLTWETATATPTEDELRNLLKNIMTIKDLVLFGPTTTAYNSLGAEVMQDEDRLRMLMKPELRNAIRTDLRSVTYNSEDLDTGIKTLPYLDFGGLTAYKEATFETQMYPVYSDATLGIQIGYSSTEGQYGASNVEATDDEVYFKDNNDDICAIIADKGLLKTFKANEFSVKPRYNERMLGTHYWAASPGNIIAADPVATCIVIRHKVSDEAQV